MYLSDFTTLYFTTYHNQYHSYPQPKSHFNHIDIIKYPNSDPALTSTDQQLTLLNEFDNVRLGLARDKK